MKESMRLRYFRVKKIRSETADELSGNATETAAFHGKRPATGISILKKNSPFLHCDALLNELITCWRANGTDSKACLSAVDNLHKCSKTMPGAMVDDDFVSLPLEERLVHKNWKCRLASYEEIEKKWRQSMPSSDNSSYVNISNSDFKIGLDLCKNIVLDANAAAQEAGLSALLILVQRADFTQKIRPLIFAPLIEKCIAAVKLGIRTKALEIILALVEADNSTEPVVTELIAFLSNKQPKIVLEFGCIDLKIIFKNILPCLFAHSDAAVRSEGYALAVELIKVNGLDKIQAQLQQIMKPVQYKELMDKEMINDKSSVKHPRVFRIHQRKNDDSTRDISDAEEDHTKNDDNDKDNGLKDVFDAEPVKIIDKVPSSFYEMVASANWKERKEALDNLFTVVNVPRLIPDKYCEIINILAKKLSDSNITIIIVAANCIESFAKGLKNDFVPYFHSVLKPLLERLKEKKNAVKDPVINALNSLINIGIKEGLTAYLEEMDSFLTHKNPQIKSETLLFLSRLLEKLPITKANYNFILENSLKSLDDATTEVRDAALKMFSCLLKKKKQCSFIVLEDKIDKTKYSKILEMTSPERQNDVKKDLPESSKKQSEEKRKHSSIQDVSNDNPGKRPKVTSTMIPANKKPVFDAKQNASSSKSVNNQNAILTFHFTEESAIEHFNSVVEPEILTRIKDSNWKVRLEAMTLLSENEDFIEKIHPEAFVRWLQSIKEINFQVYSKILTIIQKFSKKEPALQNTAFITLFLPIAFDKLTDIKLHSQTKDLLFELIEISSLELVLKNSLETELKNPKSMSEHIKWIESALTSFGYSPKVSFLVGFSKKILLTCTNPTVKSAAISLLCTLKLYQGDSLRDQLSDIPSAILNSIDAEFKKISSDSTPPEPTRFIFKAQNNFKKGKSASSEFNENVSPHPTESDDNPNVEDVANILDMALLSQTVSKQLNDSNWKVRKEGLDSLQTTVQATAQKVSFPMDLINALRFRLSDSNKNLVINTLEIIKALFEKSDKNSLNLISSNQPLLKAILMTLNDLKVAVRAAAVNSLESLLKKTPIYYLPLFTCAVPLLSEASLAQLRREFWTLLAKQYTKSMDISQLMPCLKLALADRTLEVRKAAQTFHSILLSNEDSQQKNATTYKSSEILDKSKVVPVDENVKVAVQELDSVQLYQSFAGKVSFPHLLFSKSESESLASFEQLYDKRLCKDNHILVLEYLEYLKTKWSHSQLMNSAIFKYLDHFISLMDTENIQLDEKPAKLLISLLLNFKAFDLIHKSCRIHPASKIFAILLFDQNSLIDCDRLNICHALIEKNGHSVFNPEKTLSVLLHYSSTSSSKHSTETLYSVYKLIKIMKTFKLEAKTMQTIEDELQKLSIHHSPANASNNNTNATNNNSNNNSNISQFSNIKRIAPNVSETVSEKVSLLSSEKSTTDFIDNQNIRLDLLITNLTSGISSLSYSSVIKLNEILKTDPISLEPCLKSLISSLTLQYRLVVNGLVANESDLSVAVLNLLCKIFKEDILNTKISKDSLSILVEELINQLNIDKNMNNPQLNTLMILALEKSNKNLIYSVLLELLSENYDRTKFIELVMKCLWKLTKSLKDNLSQPQEYGINQNQLLSALNCFFKGSPPSLWKSIGNDLPLKTAKTILHELVLFDGGERMLLEAEKSQYEKCLINYIIAMQKFNNENNGNKAKAEEEFHQQQQKQQQENYNNSIEKSSIPTVNEIKERLQRLKSQLK